MSDSLYGYGGFEFLDFEELMAARDAARESQWEAMSGVTMAANAGPYTAPLGPVLTREIPVGEPEAVSKCQGAHECPVHHSSWEALFGR